MNSFSSTGLNTQPSNGKSTLRGLRLRILSSVAHWEQEARCAPAKKDAGTKTLTSRTEIWQKALRRVISVTKWYERNQNMRGRNVQFVTKLIFGASLQSWRTERATTRPDVNRKQFIVVPNRKHGTTRYRTWRSKSQSHLQQPKFSGKGKTS